MSRHLIAWVRALVLRRRLEREMQEEMADHIERATERLVARGMSEGAARRQAVREFGNVPWLQDAARDARGTAWLDALSADLRYALRQYAKRPATTMTMFIVLIFGMGISTLLFSFVHSYATLAPPRIERADDLVRIRGSRTAGADGRVFRLFGEEEFRQYMALTDRFRSVAGWTDAPVLLDTGPDDASRGIDARAVFVTNDYFAVIGVRPVLGPGLSERPDGVDGAGAVINHRMWDELFGRDRSIVGGTIWINGLPVTVAGVMPDRFSGIGGFAPYLIWLPETARASLLEHPPTGFRAVARLRDGMTAAQADAAVRVIATRSAASTAEARALLPSAEVVPLLSANGDPNFDADVRLMKATLGLLGLLVVIVTCTNVSALLTGLATARRQEIAVRLSLGAARPRLVRQLLTESALLACAAAAGAVGIVALTLHLVATRVPALPLELSISWPATFFAFGLALAVGVLFGLSPALHATRLAIGSVLRDSNALIAATRARLQRGLVVAQIAFTQPLTVLLAAVLLIALSARREPPVDDLGERLVTISMSIPASVAGLDDGDQRQRLRVTMNQLRDRLAALPGVESVVLHWPNPYVLGDYSAQPDDALERTPVTLLVETASEGYFQTGRIKLVRGRELTANDAGDARQRGVIITADYARRLWGAADPIGRQLEPASDTSQLPRLTVIGVVEGPHTDEDDGTPASRVLMAPDTSRVTTSLLVRTAAAAAPLLPDMRHAIRTSVPTMVARVQTLAERDAEHMRRYWIVTSGILTAGAMALLLSAIGLYAVVALSVGQRTREIAVRLAVGGRAQQIVRGFVSDGLRLGAFGLLLGMPASVFGLYLLMRVPDVPYVQLPPVTVIAAGGIFTVATLAAWIPARRAADVEPAVTLRTD